MATNTYVALDKATVAGTSTTSVVLSGISSSYTDLRLVIHSQNQNNTNQLYIQFNADTGTGTTNYSTTSLAGNGTTAVSNRHTNNIGWYPVPGPGVGTTGNFQPWAIDIMNYSNPNIYKTGLSRFNNSVSIVSGNTHLWRSNAAISTITITAEAGAGYIVPGSTFSLYGIRAEGVSPAPKATGGAIYDDETYYYHAFGASGTFTPTQSITADILVVAGGGSGGGFAGGGGGAGGLLGFASQSLTAQNYTCTVGAGGAGVARPYNGSAGNNGTNSTFQGLTAAVGGGYGGTTGNSGGLGVGNGGSGGGRGNPDGAGSGTANQGFAGGLSGSQNGGGGGAGSAGGASSSAPIAQGGIGATFNTLVGGTAGPYAFINPMGAATGTGELSGGNYYYAGGGGGGCDGVGNLGGGGNALVSGRPSSGGGGGGACGESSTSGSGGSGVIIVRYLKA